MANKRKCRHCGEYGKPEDGIVVPLGYFCNMDHAFEYGNKNKQKGMAKKKAAGAKVERIRLKEKKESIKRPAEWRKEAQAAINLYVRLKDYQDPCISCGKPREEIEHDQGWKVGGCWDAGHFQTRGAKGQLRFNLWNIHKQCKSCNAGAGKFSHKSSTVDQEYRIRLISKIGARKVEWLENNNEIDQRKNDIEYLKRIKKIFTKKARIKKARLGI